MGLAHRPDWIPAGTLAVDTDGSAGVCTAADGTVSNLTADQLAAAAALITECILASGGAVLSHAVDASGAYLGLVDKIPPGGEHVPGPPPAMGAWAWDGATWQPVEQLATVIAQQLDAIDAHAGAARQRYITDVPGQQAVYMDKASQATSYLAALQTDSKAPAPPYVQAEADAMGVTPDAAAREILGVAQVWREEIGPRIERLRRSGKLATEKASTCDEARKLAAAAIEALRAV